MDLNNKRKNLAKLRATLAVVAAVVLVAASGFAFARLIEGPETVEDGGALANGAFVRAELAHIMDVFAVERGPGGNETAYYAVAPIGNKFTAVRFPASDFENMDALESATRAYLLGETEDIGFRLRVTGTAVSLSEEQGELLARWFNENAAWMMEGGVISEVRNYGDYLNGVMIDTARLGRVGCVPALVMTAAAALLLLYAVIVFTRVGLGKYDAPRPRAGRDQAHA